MAFNHYAKIKRILENEPNGWYIKRVNKPTSAKNFKGEVKHFEYYYRIYSADGLAIKYAKFQQLDLLAKTLKKEVFELPVIE